MSAPYKKTVLAVQAICGVLMVGTVVYTYAAAGFEKALVVIFIAVAQIAAMAVWNKYVDRRYEREIAAIRGAPPTSIEGEEE